VFKPSPRGATYDVGEDLQTVIKYLARRLDESTGTVVAMGVAVIEEAVKLQGQDSFVLHVDKEGRASGCKLSAYVDHMRNKEQ